MLFYEEIENHGDQIAARSWDGRCMTYRELADGADALADAVSQSRALVFCLCDNSIEALVGYVACLRHRHVPLLLKADIDEELLENLIAVYRPGFLYCAGERGGIASLQTAVCDCGGFVLYTTGEKVAVMSDDLALLLTTSGSTGSPKLVRQSYRNIASNAASIAEYLELDQTERPITTLPMNYTYGLSIINSHLLVGATILMTNATLAQREFWNFFKEQQATSFGGVPYTYEILKKLRFFKMDLPSLRTMTQAGGKLLPDLHREFAEYAAAHGRKFVVMYGQTEATARMAYLPSDKALEKYGSMGIAIPGGKLWLKDDEGKRITQPGVEGELVYEGPNVTLGYAECAEDLRKPDERYGVLETGDMAKMDADGYFYIVGRRKRFLKIYGNRVNLDEIERLVKKAFFGGDFACGGKDDALYIFAAGIQEEDGRRIVRYLSDKTGLNGAAFHLKVLGEIPKNGAGKTLYRALERYYD